MNIFKRFKRILLLIVVLVVGGIAMINTNSFMVAKAGVNQCSLLGIPSLCQDQTQPGGGNYNWDWNNTINTLIDKGNGIWEQYFYLDYENNDCFFIFHLPGQEGWTRGTDVLAYQQLDEYSKSFFNENNADHEIIVKVPGVYFFTIDVNAKTIHAEQVTYGKPIYVVGWDIGLGPYDSDHWSSRKFPLITDPDNINHLYLNNLYLTEANEEYHGEWKLRYILPNRTTDWNWWYGYDNLDENKGKDLFDCQVADKNIKTKEAGYYHLDFYKDTDKIQVARGSNLVEDKETFVSVKNIDDVYWGKVNGVSGNTERHPKTTTVNYDGNVTNAFSIGKNCRITGQYWILNSRALSFNNANGKIYGNENDSAFRLGSNYGDTWGTDADRNLQITLSINSSVSDSAYIGFFVDTNLYGSGGSEPAPDESTRAQIYSVNNGTEIYIDSKMLSTGHVNPNEDKDSGSGLKVGNEVCFNVTLTSGINTFILKLGENTKGGTLNRYNAWFDSFFVSPFDHYVARTMTVAFNGNGGTPSESSRFVGTNDKYGTLPTATRTGYTLDGWYTAATGGTEVTQNTVITKENNHSLYAHWTAKSVSVTFDKQSGTGGSDSTTAYYDSAMPSIDSPSRVGYGFQGYFTGTGGTGTKYYNADGTSARNCDIDGGSVTLYAHWAIKQSTVTFKDGDTVLATVTGNYGDTLTPPANPTKFTKVFNGWDKAVPSTIPAEDLVINATWRDVNYGLSLDGGTTIIPLSVKEDFDRESFQVSPATDLNLRKDSPIKFYAENVEIGSGINSEGDYNNCYTVSEGGWRINNDAIGKIYLKAYSSNNGEYKFYIPGKANNTSGQVGFKTGTDFYLKENQGWDAADAIIKVQFSSAVGQLESSTSTEIVMEKIKTSGTTNIYKSVNPVPKYTNIFGEELNVDWSKVKATRYSPSGGTWGYTDVLETNVSYNNEININNIEPGKQHYYAIIDLYSDGGVETNKGIYFDSNNVWNDTESTYFVYFFNPLDGGNSDNAWSKPMTLINDCSLEKNVFETNIPQFNEVETEWGGLLLSSLLVALLLLYGVMHKIKLSTFYIVPH